MPGCIILTNCIDVKSSMPLRRANVFVVCMVVVWVLMLFYMLVRYLNISSVQPNDVEHIQQSLMSSDQYPQDVINVCMTADERRIIGMVAAINSIYKNTKHPVKFYLLVSASAYDPLTDWINYSQLKAIDHVIKVFEADRFNLTIKTHGGRPELASVMNYARYYYTEVFPELTGQAVHIDDDSIIQGDISQLIPANLSKNLTVAFSSDCKVVAKALARIDTAYFKYVNFSNDHIRSLNLNPTECSFNTGVYAFDVDGWRLMNATAKLSYWLSLNTREHVYGNRHVGGGSQPPMLLVFYKQYADLNPLWNVRHLGMPSGQRYPQAVISGALLLHWSGPWKPWLAKSAWTSVWDRYYIPDPNQRYRPVRKYG